MGRGVSAGGGQSSLGYLFGSGENTNNASKNPVQPPKDQPPQTSPPTPSESVDNKQGPAGANGNNQNNYFRADGQNSGNFLTDRPTTKVHAAPGGGSSLGYLFGDGGK